MLTRKLPPTSDWSFADGTSEDLALERHYSISDLVALWGLSEKTLRRIFANEPGVVEIGRDEDRFRRAYKTLRIPESVVVRVHRRIRRVS